MREMKFTRTVVTYKYNVVCLNDNNEARVEEFVCKTKLNPKNALKKVIKTLPDAVRVSTEYTAEKHFYEMSLDTFMRYATEIGTIDVD